MTAHSPSQNGRRLETYAPRPFTRAECCWTGIAVGFALGVLLMHYAGVLS